MSVIHQHPSIDWQQLAQALREQRCVLLLGPDVCCDFKKATPEPMTRKLAMHLSQHIEAQDNTPQLINHSTLSYVAAAYETSFVDEDLDTADNLHYARAKRKSAIKKFYGEHQNCQFSFYEQLVRLPFHIIINTSHYDFLNKIFTHTEKKLQDYYFNYKKPAHNGRLKFETPTENNPLIYNLFGRIDDIESLVLTEADQIFFSENIVQKEATATLPSDLRALLLRKNPAHNEYIFLFMGFDFREWHLRILLHFLFKHENNEQKYTAIALQKPDDIHPLTHFLYEKHFLVNFHQIPPLDFLDELKKQLIFTPTARKPEPQAGKRLFILHHDQEDDLCEELKIELAMLKRNEVISEIQSRADITHGEWDKEMQGLIREADIVVLIVTSKFLADDKLYGDYLPLALQRHHNKEARVIPVVMSYCMWQESDVNLPTMLPQNGDPISSTPAQRSKDLTDIATGIKKIIDRFWKIT